MKKTARFFLFVSVVATLLLSACGASATPQVESGKVEAMPVAFTGIVQSMAGDQWVINGQTVTVDPAVVRNGPFNAGDQVKVEGVVNVDGSFTVSRVEVPNSQDLSTLPSFGGPNSTNDNSNNANVNDANSNAVNSNDINSNDANVNDNNSNVSNDNSANVNDDNGNAANSNDDNGGGGVGGNDNGSGNNNSGGGNHNGGGGNGGGGNGGGGSDDDGGGNGNDG